MKCCIIEVFYEKLYKAYTNCILIWNENKILLKQFHFLLKMIAI